jgi:Amt family ammonium transporter
MTQFPSPAPLDSTQVLCILAVLLIPFTLSGLSLINTGLGRLRSAAHAMLSPLAVIGVAAAVYFICGFAWQGYIGSPVHSVTLAGKPWSLIGAGSIFFGGLPLDAGPASLAAWSQMFAVGLAALIPLGAAGDRWRLAASCASTALLAGFIYPLFAHWVWGGGWLAQLGLNASLGRGFLDAGGASSIQVVGGLTALSVAWILGPRQGKYSSGGMPTAIPGHNSVYVLFGCFMTFVGWLGLNIAGAILFFGAEPGRAVLIAVNTTLAAGAAVLMAILVTRYRFGRPDVSISANGWVGGLVAISAGCAFVPPIAALLVGSIAGILVALSVEWFEAQFRIDDPSGAISAHAVAGVWGLLAVGFFARSSVPVANISGSLPTDITIGEGSQLLAQLVGIATLVGFILPLTYGLNLVMNKFCPYRVASEGERRGLDLYELGGGAYPEFVTHTEEFTIIGAPGKPPAS